MKFEKIIVGGTFDHFHLGHQAILNRAFSVAKYVYIGITSDEFVGRIKNLATKYPLSLENFDSRQKALVGYLQKQKFLHRAIIVKIEDKYDISISESPYEAIIVSEETAPVAQEINRQRTKNGLKNLQIELVPWVLADDKKPINSFRIRGGMIDREGKLFNVPSDWKVRFLPQSLRQQLKKPLGELFPDESKNHEQGVAEFTKKYLGRGFCVIQTQEFRPRVMAVGDAVCNALLNFGIVPDISIVDLKIKRIPVYKDIAEIGFRNIKVHKFAKNIAGTININAFKTLADLIRNEATPAVLQIDGEDDLMALVACYLSPLNYLIVYGQPDEGIVVIRVLEETKKIAKEMLDQFLVI